jgi:hypothetical protein
MLTPALRIFPSKALRDFIVARTNPDDLMSERELAAAALGARDFVGAIRNGGNPGIYHHSACDWVPRCLKLAALAAEKDPGFWKWAEKWTKEQKANPKPPRPMPPEVKGRVQLGALSTEPHPAGG